MINNGLIKITDVIAIIKPNDIYEHLGIATDNCEDAANVLSDSSSKHT